MENMNLYLKELRAEIEDEEGKLELYVLSTIKKKFNRQTGIVEFLQTGCGPNFQGDVITQCTCRHDIRTRHED